MKPKFSNQLFVVSWQIVILSKAKNLLIWALISIFASVLLFGCAKKSTNETIILATTTSLNDTGLLDYLLPMFTKETGIKIKPIAVGSGEALKMGARGDADIILAHSPDKEKELVASGKASRRTSFMYNYFALVGPKDDPAKISDSKSAEEAFSKVEHANNIFVSRADESGTHKKELKIWEEAKLMPLSNIYVKTGQGMAETLNVANEKEGYVLTDKATFSTYKKNLNNLKLLLTNKKSLKNTYSVIELNPKKVKIKFKAAQTFKKWLLSKSILKKISTFGAKKYGEPLFIII